ncbi:MAG: DUF6479 family protein [Candidatus Micrarchaeia archaeon]
MRKAILIALLLIAAFIFGCAQKAEQPPQQEQPEQPKVTTPIEDIAANELEKEMPAGEENFTELDELLVNSAV